MFRRYSLAFTLAVTAFFVSGCTPDRSATGPASTEGGLNGAARRTNATPASVGAIRINEVESNLGTPGDWVELYNPGSTPVDLSGLVFRDNDNVRVPYVIPAGTTIAANGFLVLDEAQFGFGLGSSDAARLFEANGTTVIDSYTWTAHASTTYGRCPDGSGAFATVSVTTKGSANDCDVLIRINEVESSGGTPADWVELFNPSAAAVSLAGYVLRDSDDANSYVMPAGTTIPANGHLVLEQAQFTFDLGAPDGVRLFRANGTTMVDGYSWTTHAATTYGRCPDGIGALIVTSASTKGTANACSTATTAVKINEVESNLGSPGDWVELFNTGSTSVDLTGYVFRDNNDAANYVLPAGSVIAGGGYLVLDEAQFGFGLGGADAARLFAPGGVTVVDSYAWTAHASTTYGRCPDGTGPFLTTSAPTKGGQNVCGPAEVFAAWPGDASVSNADDGGVFGGNMSGLSHQLGSGQSIGVLWAVKNGPGTLYRLQLSGSNWSPAASKTWVVGKPLRYPDGTGDVDAEGVLVMGNAIYVAAERNNANSSVSRNSILLFDVSVEGTPTLTATREWNITADLPVVGANLGLEGITRIPDTYLVANGFLDESKGRAYLPSDYPNHGAELFFVGVEGNGMVYAYALDHQSGDFTRVAAMSGGNASVMELQFDTELNQLWSICDNTCSGRSAVLQIDTQSSAASRTRGRFVVTRRFERPTGMPDLNNEGFAFAPLAECTGGRRPVFWADDGATGTVALRRGSITCSAF